MAASLQQVPRSLRQSRQQEYAAVTTRTLDGKIIPERKQTMREIEKVSVYAVGCLTFRTERDAVEWEIIIRLSEYLLGIGYDSTDVFVITQLAKSRAANIIPFFEELASLNKTK